MAVDPLGTMLHHQVSNRSPWPGRSPKAKSHYLGTRSPVKLAGQFGVMGWTWRPPSTLRTAYIVNGGYTTNSHMIPHQDELGVVGITAAMSGVSLYGVGAIEGDCTNMAEYSPD